MLVQKVDNELVTIWRLSLTEVPDETYLLDLLDTDEQQRAARYGHVLVRRRFLICRAALRLLLAQCLVVDPCTLRLKTDAWGKPYLAKPSSRIVFNLSHTDDLALIALTFDHALGVDIEGWRATRSQEAIARRCFAATEFAYWRALPENRRTEAFFTLWTRKEAFAKAVGTGISIGLERIVFGIDDRLIAVPSECGDPENWLVQDLVINAGFSAAVAVKNAAAQVKVKEMMWAI